MELKEELRKLGLAGTGYKNELIARLNRSTPNGTWSELRPEVQVSEDIVEVANEESGYERSERGQTEETIGIRSAPQSPEALEMELEIVRQELALLKARSATGSTSGTHRTPEARTSVETGWVRSEITINTIAELLPVRRCKGRFLYVARPIKIHGGNLPAESQAQKILVGLRLRGKALAWLHSSRKHMQLTTEELLRELEAMYDQQADSMILHEEGT
jgi:hypothetical protein